LCQFCTPDRVAVSLSPSFAIFPSISGQTQLRRSFLLRSRLRTKLVAGISPR
jgi:hypothetical protein